MPFNPSLNFLRAVAVLLVMLYHFVPTMVPGGYVGVDVFFVISGYLMTAIVFSGLKTGQFSLLTFYAARARRILPALLGLVASLAVLGYWLLPVDDYRSLLQTAKSALQFTSNIQFAAKGSYFDSPLKENWLLHTWSLSVEWQFYLLYPLILLLAARIMSQRHITDWLLPTLTTASLAAGVYVTHTTEQWAFYMLPSRAWELLVGGLAYCHAPRLNVFTAKLFSMSGLLALTTATFMLNQTHLWPGYLAVIPVMATVLIILGSRLPEDRLTRPFHWVGTRSYSIYLWHWPIVVLLYTCGLLEDSTAIGTGMLAAVILGAFSWHLLERKARPLASPKRVMAVWFGLAAVGIALCASTTSLLKKGVNLRPFFVEPAGPEYTSRLFPKHCETSPWNAAECVLGTGAVNVILMGDSHAESTAAAIQYGNSGAAQLWALGGCPTLLTFEMRDKDRAQKCRAFNAEKLKRLSHDFPGLPLILFSRSADYIGESRSRRVWWPYIQKTDSAQFTQHYMDAYAETVCALGRNRPLYIVRPIPEMPFVIHKGLYLQARLFGSSSDISIPLATHQRNHELANAAIDAAAQQCQAIIIDPIPRLCPQGRCMGSRDGVALYFDDNHLVDEGNRVLMGLFDGVIAP
ncbi:acyltransferase family protein [Pseudomonas putida]